MVVVVLRAADIQCLTQIVRDGAARHGLTAREAEIMALIAQRKSRAEIEQQLFLSQNTVKTHVRHLYAKLGAATKADVIALFEE